MKLSHPIQAYCAQCQLVQKVLTGMMFIIFFRDINIPLPAVDVDPPSYWWDEDADKSLLIGVYKHGKRESCM